MSERDVLAELEVATAENPLILERPLTVEEQVLVFNENYFGIQNDVRSDWQYPVAVSGNMIELVRKEKGAWWGSLEQIFRYSIENCINLGYLPWRIEYVSFDKQDDFDGGLHKFIIICEDKRKDNIAYEQHGFGQP